MSNGFPGFFDGLPSVAVLRTGRPFPLGHLNPSHPPDLRASFTVQVHQMVSFYFFVYTCDDKINDLTELIVLSRIDQTSVGAHRS